MTVFSLGLLLAACGGGDTPDRTHDRAAPPSSAPSPSPSPTYDRAGFDAAAEAICARFSATDIPPDAPDADLAARLVTVRALEAAFVTAHAELSRLEYPPYGTGAELRQILVVGLGENVAELTSARSELEAAVAAKDRERVRAAGLRLIRFSEAQPDKNGVLVRNHLDECSLAFSAE